ncbi:hypothetical protein Pmani_012944 [Petrolisthes manimaculis]|uniref:Uncharacterized protein n=1 Tax=Petrolisthes manimaculis TaxID=1843537 RepID=A0AAE1PZG8_9EUCA|nr:hypothetical protein Pmani_012944 [Petrolisthes manimaculis]
MVKVSCETSSSKPPSSVTWRLLSTTTNEKEGVTLPQLHQPTTKHIPGLYGGTVTRSKVRVYVRAEDRGRVLKCEADNGLGLMVTTNVTLNVLHGPVWEVTPLKKYEVPEGGNLTIKAFAQANPGPVSYKWQKGRKELYGEITEDGEGILKLSNIERKQAGNYTVLVSSSKGFIPAFFTISVQYAPDNISVPERVLVDQNETVSIKCRASGNPTPNVSWTRSSDENSVVLASGQGEVVLTVEGASSADTGIYLCHAANIIGALHPAFTALVVTQAPATTSTHLAGKDVEYDSEEKTMVAGKSWSQVGGAALLDCRIMASPQPAFNWTRADGYKVISGKKYFIHVPQLVDGVAEWSSVLEVKKVDLEDLTNFTCYAQNALGSHSEIYALSQPSHLGSPLTLNVTVLNERSALVQWIDTVEAPQPIGYTIRFRTDAYKQYEMVDVPGTNISSWLLEDLLPGAEYSFTLQSYDVHGRPYHTSPTFDVIMSPDGEVYGDGDDDMVPRTPEGIPLLMFVLIALTGGALCILNITGALCFLRKRTFFQGIRVGSTRKESGFEVPSPSFVDQLSLSSADDIPPPDYESVMGTVQRDIYGGSVDDMRRPSRSSRGTPSLARSSDILTSSSTISAGGDLDLDDIIAPPDDFCNGLMSRRAAPPPPRSALRQARDTWTSLEDGRTITQQVLSQQGAYMTISHQPSTPGPRPVGQAAAASTFHYSMDSLACPQTPMPTPVLPKVSSQVIYHGQPHLQQQLEQEQYQQYQMQYQQYHQQQQLHFQYPPPMRRSSPPMHQTSPHMHQTSPPMHQTSPPMHQTSPPMHQTSPPMHQTSPPMHQTSPPMHQTSPPMHQTSPPMHQTSPPMHQTSPPMQQQTSPPMQQQTSPPMRQTSPPMQQASPPMQQASPPMQQASPPMQQTSPPFDRQQQQQQQQQQAHDGQYYLQQQQQQFCYQTSPNESTTQVPPPYASLDPSTLYSMHPTIYEDDARAGPSYPEWSPGSSGRSEQGHS